MLFLIVDEKGDGLLNTIRRKVATIAIVCSLITGLSLGILSFVYSGSIANEDSYTLMLTRSEETKTKLDNILASIEQSVDTLTEVAIGQLDDFDKFRNNEKYVEKYTKRIENIVLQFAEKTDGALTAYVRYNPDFTPPTSGIFYMRDSLDAQFSSVEPTDFSIYAKDDLEHVGWYYIPVENKKPTWMNPYVNQNINVSMISYVVPIYIDDVSVGIIGMDISLSTIEGLVNEAKIYSEGYSCLLDANHNFVVHKDYELGDSLKEKQPEIEKLIANEENEDKVLDYDYQGTSKMMVYEKLRNGMKCMLTASVSDVRTNSIGLLKIMILFLLVAIGIAGVFSFFISRTISRPMQQITALITKIADLNLQKDDSLLVLSKRKDEIGKMAQEVDRMSQELGEITLQIEQSCSVVNDGVQTLESTMKDTNGLCEDNSATMEQMSAGMQQSAATMNVILKNVESVNGNVKDMTATALQGNEISKEIKKRAESLKEHTKEANTRTRKMYADMKDKSDVALEQAKAVSKIHELVQTISEISSQTNLLALNASIEAARAGEAGKGFAVVASEIGSLANQTQVSADDIKEMVQEVQQAVDSMQSCIGISAEFLEKTVMGDYQEFGEVGNAYSTDANTFEEFMTDIHDRVEELERAMDEIVQSLGVIDQAVGDSATGVSDIADKTSSLVNSTVHAGEMVGQSVENINAMRQLVSKFTL